MKKSLRILFTMLLALVGMSSWAQTQLDVVGDLKNDKVYQIKCKRDYLGVSAYGYMNGVASAAKYSTPGDDNKFAILKGNNGYYLYATERAKFVPTTGKSTTATGIPALNEPVAAFDIQGASKAGSFLIISQESNCWIMLGGGYQYLANDGWDKEDDGDVWSIYEIGDLDPEVKAAAVAKIEALEGQPFPKEATVEVAKLTLTAEYNESKTVATVTIDGLTGNGVVGAYFFGEDLEEPAGTFAPGEESTIQIAPNSYPASLVVTVREYDEETNVLAEGHIVLNFPRDTSLFDDNKFYTLRTASNHYLSALDAEDGVLATVEDAAEAGKFRIEYFAGDYFLYNANLKKYLSVNGNDAAPYVDEKDGGFNIFLSTESGAGQEGAWLIVSNVTENWMQVNSTSFAFQNGNSYQVLDANNQWYIEETEHTEPAAPVAELTLSYMLNEAKTLATVTVEEGLVEAEGSMVIYFLNDDEETAQMLEGSNQFTVAPTSAPEIVKVTVRQYDAEMENVLAEGEININFPEVVTAELLYTVSATYSALTFNEDGEEFTLAPYVEGNAQVDVYEGFAVIHNALGMDGTELKVAYSEYDEQMEYNHITSLELTGAAGQFTYDDDGYYIYTDEATRQAMVVSPQWAVINEQKGSITMLVQDFFNGSLTAYYLVWGEEGEQPDDDAPLYTLNGQELDRPNDYICEMLGMGEDDVIIPMSEYSLNSNVKVDVYEDYFIIRDFMGAYGVDLQCWYQVDDSDEKNPQTMVYKYQIVGQEFSENEIPGNVSGSYIVVNMEGYDLAMGMCNLNPMGGWLTILANKLSDMENYYHYSLDFSPAIEVEKPTVDPVEGTYDELQTITITFDQAVTIPVEDWENGVYFVPQPYITGEDTYTWESAALVAGENEGEVIFTLENPIVRGDVYTFTLPKGCVIFEDGTECPEFTYTYTITGNNYTVTTEEGETSMTITPASGETVSVLETFDVLLTGFINIPAWEVDCALYDEDGEEVCQASFNDNYDGTYSIELWKKVTKAGTYTLKFTVPNQNEAWKTIGTHEYEATYTVDGSEYVEMPYTVWGRTSELPEEENYDNDESAVKLGLAHEIVIDEDNFVIKNLFGIEGLDLTAQYQVWGSWCYVSGISVPGTEGPSMQIEVTPSEEIGTVALMVAGVQLDPKEGYINIQVVDADENYSYYYIVWNPEITTGVNSLKAETNTEGIYNLNGQRVVKTQNGLYIINGKKVVIK